MRINSKDLRVDPPNAGVEGAAGRVALRYIALLSLSAAFFLLVRVRKARARRNRIRRRKGRIVGRDQGYRSV